MDKLPNEVLLNIANSIYDVTEKFQVHGDKPSLLSMRATCKKLSEIGRSIAFKHVSFLQDEPGYKKLGALSASRNAGDVRYLTCLFQGFENRRQDFFKYVKNFSYLREKIAPEDIKQLYVQLNHGRQYQRFLEHKNLDVAFLTAAFVKLPKLRSLRIAQSFENTTEVSGFIGSTCLEYAHLLELPTGARFFSAVTSALNASVSSITSLTLQSWPEDDTEMALTGILQRFSSKDFALYKSAFPKLSHLKVVLPWIEEKGGHDSLNGLLEFIHCLPSLRELEFSAPQYFSATLHSEFMLSLEIPHLRSLDIANGIFRCPEDIEDLFRRHSATLKRISLYDVVLDEGSWEEVFAQMRACLALENCEMKGSFCLEDIENVEIGYGMRSHGEMVLPAGAIENYVKRRTDVDPFDLMRATVNEYPPHYSMEERALCYRGFCPYRYYTSEAANAILASSSTQSDKDCMLELLARLQEKDARRSDASSGQSSLSARLSDE